MRVWVCMLYQKWAHTQINGCVQAYTDEEGNTSLRSKPTHPNCGRFEMEKTE